MRYTEMITRCYPDDKKNMDRVVSLWLSFVVRPISFLFTYLFWLCRITANQATFIGFLVGLVAICMAAYGEFIMAAAFLNLFWIVDCVDGNLARLSSSSSNGEFFDAVVGDVINYLFPFVFLYSAATSGQMRLEAIIGEELLIIAITCMSFLQLLTALASQRHKIILSSEKDTNDDRIKPELGLVETLVRNMYGAAFLYPASILVAATEAYDALFVFLILTGLVFYIFSTTRPILSSLLARFNFTE